MLYIISLVLTTGSLYLFTAFIHFPSPNSPPDNHKSFSVYLFFWGTIKTYNTVFLLYNKVMWYLYIFKRIQCLIMYCTKMLHSYCLLIIHCTFHTWVIYFATKYLYLLISFTSFLLWSLATTTFWWCCVHVLDSTYSERHARISLGIIPSRSIHILANGKIFLFMASLVQCVYTTSLHLYSLCIDGYLGCFRIFAAVNSAANIEVHVNF